MTTTAWSQTTRTLIIVGTLLAAIWLIIAVRPLLETLLIAALLTYLLDPVVRLLERRTRLNHSWAARVVYVLFLLALASIPTTLGAIAVGQFHRLQTQAVAAIDALRQWLFKPINILGYTLRPQSLLDNLGQLADNALAALPSGSFDILSGVTTNLLWGVTILVTLYYLLKDGPKIKPWLVGLAPDEYQDEFQRLLEEINGIWGTFLRAQLLIFVILAVLMGGGTLLVIWLFQTDLLAFSPLAFILLLILVYTAAQQVDNLWLHPHLMGNRLRLHPGLVFVGLAGALALSGALGVIVVVPCIATVKVVGSYVRSKIWGLAPSQPDQLAVIEESTHGGNFYASSGSDAESREQSNEQLSGSRED